MSVRARSDPFDWPCTHSSNATIDLQAQQAGVIMFGYFFIGAPAYPNAGIVHDCSRQRHHPVRLKAAI